MKEVFSGTLAVASIGWITVEGMLSGNPLLIIGGFLTGILAFAILGCLPGSNSHVNNAGFIFSLVLVAFGVLLAGMSFADGKILLGCAKLLFFLALLASSFSIYAKEKALFAKEGHSGDGH